MQTYLEICDPNICIYVSTMDRKLRDPFAGWQKEDAGHAKMKADVLPKHVEGEQGGPRQRSLEDGKPPR